jgi:hypothetical protein
MHYPTFCPGPANRRDFLRAGFLGLGGLALPDLLRARAEATDDTSKEMACILVWLHGGPSHLETYDLKPDAPAEIRGEFRPMATRVPGLKVCELLPRHARIADKFSLIRSVTHEFSAHAGGVQQVLTGRPPKEREKDEPDFPDLGSIVKRVRSQPGRDLPSSVSIPSRVQSGGPAYLGKGYEPFVLSGNLRDPNYRVPNLALPLEAAARLSDRRALLQAFDRVRREADASGAMQALDQYQQEAVNLLLGERARRAFDFSTLEPRERDCYGRTQVGQSLLAARRLVEAGVNFVTVQAGGFDTPGGNGNWDDHAVSWNIFDQMKLRLPVFDQAVSALIEDIHQRGLERRVLVAVLGEFGRTPKVSVVNGRPGREHYPQAMSILVSGGGLKMGQVVGSTDAKGTRPKDRPFHPVDFLATVYDCLGIDARQEFPDFGGRPLAILPHGTPIADLIG